MLVEGWSDKHFFDAFVEFLGLTGIQVMAIGGKTELPAYLSVLRISPNFSKVRKLTIIRDSDSDPGGAFQSVCAHLSNAGLPVPCEVGDFTEGTLKTCVYLMPRKGAAGSLEDLCLEAVSSRPEMQCVDSFFSCLKTRGGSYPRNESKARVQAFLASKESTLQFGAASEKGYWPWDCPAFEGLRSLLAALSSTGS